MEFKLVVPCIIAVLAVGNFAYADDETSTYEFRFMGDQSVSGSGFFNTYQDMTTGQTSMNKLDHGSGTYIYDAKSKMNIDNFGSTGTGRDQQTISLDESMDAIYSGAKFGLKGSTGTIPFNSLIGERICVTNYRQGPELNRDTSMNAKFLYADKLKKSIGAQLYWNDNSSNAEWEDYTHRQQSITTLNLEAEFSGKAHIGMVTDTVKARSPVRVALIDEDYWGTFSITKKMTQSSLFSVDSIYDDWLPCCTGGWNGMDIHDQRGHGSSAKGIFDCSCYNVPQAAEFQRK